MRLGQTLVQLDDDMILTQLGQARSNALQGQASRAQAQAELQRSAVEIESTRAQARAQLQQAEAAMTKQQNFTRSQEKASAKAALVAAEADERQAHRDVERFEQLLEEGAVPIQQAERQRTQWEASRGRLVAARENYSLACEGARSEDRNAAQAQVAQARAAVRLADSGPVRLQALQHQVEGLSAHARQVQQSLQETQILLERHRIAAPFAGRILALYVQPGDLVSPGTPVARIGRVDRLKATFGVPEGPRTRLHLGQPVRLSVNGQACKGKIFSLGFEADPKTHNFPVEVVLENKNESLLPKMVARLELNDSLPARRLLLPVSSLSSDGQGHFVYVVDSGAAHRRDVVLGSPIRDRIEIVSGVAEGEIVAAHPQRLTDGMKVSLAK